MNDSEKSYWKNESYKAYCPNIILSHDLTIGEVGYEKCDPKHKWGPGVRNFWTFHYVSSGKGVLLLNGKRYDIKENDFFVMGPNDYVAYEADGQDPWTYRWISFNGARAADIMAHVSIGTDNPVVNLPDADCAALMEKIYTGVEYTEVPRYFALGHLYLFVEWLLKTFPRDRTVVADKTQEYFYTIVNYIESHFCAEMSVQLLSGNLGFDRTYIFKLFKKFTGRSPSVYIECLKTYKACMLIDQGKYTLREVAYRSGFSDYNWFCKVFRKCAGVTPREYSRTEDKAYIMNSYNLTLPRDVLAAFKRFSKESNLR